MKVVVVFEKGRDDSCQTLSCPSSLEFKNIPFSFPSSSLSGIGFPGLERFYTAREKLSNPDILGTVPARISQRVLFRCGVTNNLRLSRKGVAGPEFYLGSTEWPVFVSKTALREGSTWDWISKVPSEHFGYGICIAGKVLPVPGNLSSYRIHRV